MKTLRDILIKDETKLKVDVYNPDPKYIDQRNLCSILITTPISSLGDITKLNTTLREEVRLQKEQVTYEKKREELFLELQALDKKYKHLNEN